MADTATHLVDHVIPRVPVRQWVLSVPRPIRYLFARDSKLLSAARRMFVSEIFRDYRRRAGIRSAREGAGGAVTAIQRFGSALNLNIHFHTIALDGVYEAGETPRFRRVDPPSRDDLDRVLSRARLRILRLLSRRGYLEGFGSERTEVVALEEASLFDAVQAASIQERTVVEGRRVGVIGVDRRAWAAPDEKPYCVTSGDGWSLQAGVRIRAGDRAGLERLCGYVLRPALAADRLKMLPDGRIAYGFRKPRFDGATHVVLTPLQLVEKMAALVAPPRAHQVCYDGALAPHAKVRSKVTVEAGGERHEDRHGGDEQRDRPAGVGRPKRNRTRWADLMARWLGMDVMLCPKCGNRMKMLALITDRSVAPRMLRAMGLSDATPELARPRPPPDDGFEFVQVS
jgi:hypothetical protein